MNKFEYMEKYGYEQLCFFHHKETGLKAITCIHSTALGPALGGSRFWNYANEEEAVEDALRLAKGMSYKNACAGLNLGGGKSVIIGDAKELRKDSVKSESFWRAFGRYLEGLGGRYITAEDVNTTTQDMVYISMETKNVSGLPGKSGNPSPFTALGVFKALEACCMHVYGSTSVEGKTVAVQGLGNVGYGVCQHLHKGGAKLIVTDIDQEKVAKAVNELGATSVPMDEIFSVDCDIYAPCALGATVNDDTIPQFKCKIICGAANNVLKEATIHGPALKEAGIVYAPDYVANAGGVINVAYEVSAEGYNEAASTRDVERIYDRMLEILEKSKATGECTYSIADKMAEERMSALRNVHSIYLGK